MEIVSGIYEDERSLTRAVRSLQQRSVPADAIRLMVEDAEGRRRDVPVDLESGVLRGAMIGGAVGGLAAAVLFTLASTGTIDFPGASLVASSAVLAALQGAIAGTAVGGAFGGLIGIGRFFSRPHLESGIPDEGVAIISVHSDELSGVARKVLTETGAGPVPSEAERA